MVSFSHLEHCSSFLTGNPASCLVPLQSILHPESRAILLKYKSGHLSPPCLNILNDPPILSTSPELLPVTVPAS